MAKLNYQDVKEQAKWEINIERFEMAVKAEKEKLRRHKPLWKKIFPYKIVITKE